MEDKVKYQNYMIEYFMCILKIELMHEKNVGAPQDEPIWLVKLIDYLFSEYSNSHDVLYFIGQEFSLANGFEDLKHRLLSVNLYALQEANDKCHWKTLIE